MIESKDLKARLASRDRLIGSWVTFGHPSIVEAMASEGFDWLTIDLEHSVVGLEACENCIRAASLKGVPALIRTTSNDEDQIKRVMDAGASGVIVPNVCSAAEADQVVRHVRYPDRGRRGVGLARMNQWGDEFDEYIEWLQKDSVIIVQIEDIRAVENLEEILLIPGIDGIIIGPYDLSASMGLPGKFDDKTFQQAKQQIIDTAMAKNISVGIHLIEPEKESLSVCLEEGYNFVAFSLDFKMIKEVSRSAVVAFKGDLK